MNNNHFIDKHSNSLDKFEFIWDHLSGLFSGNMPRFFIIEHIDGKYSYSDLSQTLWISNLHYNNKPVYIIAHESTHVCLYGLTKGVSLNNNCKFLDEGFAEYLSDSINKSLNKKLENALFIAYREYGETGLPLNELQDWSGYYYKSLNKKAYDVSLSIVNMLVEKNGVGEMIRFFSAIGDNMDIIQSMEDVYHLNIDQMEDEWIKMLNNMHPDKVNPVIVQIYPDINYPVRPDTEYIEIEFSQDMMEQACFSMPDSVDIIYGHKWINPRLLRIFLNPLTGDVCYNIRLNCPDEKIRFTSVYGTELKNINIKFITTKK